VTSLSSGGSLLFQGEGSCAYSRCGFPTLPFVAMTGGNAACEHFPLRLMTVRQNFIFAERINLHFHINFC